MRLVIQRVDEALVTVEEKPVGVIDKGLAVLVGFSRDDNEELLLPMANKLLNMRLFPGQKPTDYSVLDVEGGLLLISQFTLYARNKKGRRPDFTRAMDGEQAAVLFNSFCQICQDGGANVERGSFGNFMTVKLSNSGPLTIILDSDDI